MAVGTIACAGVNVPGDQLGSVDVTPDQPFVLTVMPTGDHAAIWLKYDVSRAMGWKLEGTLEYRNGPSSHTWPIAEAHFGMGEEGHRFLMETEVDPNFPIEIRGTLASTPRTTIVRSLRLSITD